MIKKADLKTKASEYYPDSEESRKAFIAGCKYMAKVIYDRQSDKKEEVRHRSEPFYEGFKNACDGVRIFLSPISFNSVDAPV